MVEAETLFELLHWEMVAYLNGTRDMAVKGDADTTLDQIGFRVGQSIIERLTKDIPRFRDELELVKYLCKDFWGQLYKKQIDNLRTNRQGVYVLQDNNFRILNRISANEQYKDEARRVSLSWYYRDKRKTGRTLCIDYSIRLPESAKEDIFYRYQTVANIQL